jgi:predicted membrane GTPase involved in stress response
MATVSNTFVLVRDNAVIATGTQVEVISTFKALDDKSGVKMIRESGYITEQAQAIGRIVAVAGLKAIAAHDAVGTKALQDAIEVLKASHRYGRMSNGAYTYRVVALAAQGSPMTTGQIAWVLSTAAQVAAEKNLTIAALALA